MQGLFSRLTAARRRGGNQEKQIEHVYAKEEEQERRGVLENVSAQFSPRHPICYDSYCLCDLSRDEKQLNSFSVVMLKEILRYFEVPFASRDRRKNLVVNLSTFSEEMSSLGKQDHKLSTSECIGRCRYDSTFFCSFY